MVLPPLSIARPARAARPVARVVLLLAAGACAARAGLAQDAQQAGDPSLSPELAAWERFLERIDVYGDFRLRHESSFEQVGRDDRHRERLRFRLGASYRVIEQLTIGARLATGDPDDPNSPHVTLGDVFDGLDFTLDRLFATWRPRGGDGPWVTAGKFGHAFRSNPVYGELVWDADVQPEGLALGKAFGETGPFERVDAVLGGYTVLEQASSEDAFAIVGQVSARARPSQAVSAGAALGYYHYTDVTPDGSSVLLAEGGGNATRDLDGDGAPDAFVSEFGVLDAIADVTWERPERPVTLSLEAIRNLRADIDDDSGWAAGASYGRAREKGDWRVYYQWQVVERDAVFAAFAQDDFLLATNHRSHVAGAEYKLSDGVGLHLWGLISALQDTSPGATTNDDSDQWRVRLDLNVNL